MRRSKYSKDEAFATPQAAVYRIVWANASPLLKLIIDMVCLGHAAAMAA